ncbi:lipopolysaccharide biosynthesis protein [bacterium]|nr:lipopolysaccharide biosynthesis protein [bacterium]
MSVRELIKFLFSNDGSLKKKVLRGGVWVFILRIFQRGLEFIRTIILARLLVPKDFGLMGIAMLTMSALNSFSQTGIKEALIQKQGGIKDYLNTAWTIQVIRGLTISAILFFGAPLVGSFFAEPGAVPLTRALALSELFKAFTHIGVVYFQKELEFQKQFLYQIVGVAADLLISVSTAIVLRSPWAMVYGLIGGNFVRCLLSYVIIPSKLKISLDQRQAQELWNFGKWIFGSGALIFLITQGDDIFVGKVLGATMLGFYQMAYRISNLPATEITHVISQITFPAYAKLQDNKIKLQKAYLKVLKTTAFLSFPMAGLIFILAPDFTRIFLGDKWMPMVPVIQILTLWGLIRSIGATTTPVISATGRPEVLTKYQLFQLVMLSFLIYPLSARFGIIGTSLAVVFASIGANSLACYTAVQITSCSIKRFIVTIFFPLVDSLLTVLFALFLKTYCINSMVMLLVLFTLCIMFYGLVHSGTSYLLDKALAYKARKSMKELF